MKQPICSRLQQDIYGAEIALVVGCGVDELEKVLKDTWGYACDCSDLSRSAQGYYIPIGPGSCIIWVEDKKDISTLMHELLHAALAILDNRGVCYDDERHEALTYYHEFLFNWACEMIVKESRRAIQKKR